MSSQGDHGGEGDAGAEAQGESYRVASEKASMAVRDARRAGDAAGAVRLAAAFAEAHPGDAYNWGRLGITLADCGRHVEALAAYDRALALDPQDWRFLGNRAGVLAELGRVEEALTGYDAAIAAGDGSASRYNKALLLREAGHPLEAIRCLRDAVGAATTGRGSHAGDSVADSVTDLRWVAEIADLLAEIAREIDWDAEEAQETAGPGGPIR